MACVATKLSLVEGDVRVTTLLYSLGKEAEQVLKTLTFEEGEDEGEHETTISSPK